MSQADDHRKPHRLTPEQLNELFDWLYENGDKINELNRLKNKVLANAEKRCRRQLSSYRVRNPDGMIYRKPQRKKSDRSRPRPGRNGEYPDIRALSRALIELQLDLQKKQAEQEAKARRRQVSK